MTVMKYSILAAGLIGGAVALSGANPAQAATVAPGLAQSGEKVGVQQVTHDPRARPGRFHGQRHWGQRHWQPRHHRYGYTPGWRRSGPAIGFGLSVPGFHFGIGVPTRQHYAYGHGRPFGYGYHGRWGY